MSAGWVRASKSRPCRLCGGPDNCEEIRGTQQGEVGWNVYCGRVSDGAIRQNDGGQWLHFVRDDAVIAVPRPMPERKPVTSPKPNSTYWAGVVQFCEEIGRDRLPELATVLGVSIDSLRRLRVGFSRKDDAWTFPERNDAGEFIGVNRRFQTGDKQRAAGASSGLTFADDWIVGDGPIFLPEGGSDAAAGLTMGLNMVGRPSNVGGVPMLAELLAHIPPERAVIVIGERDRKPHDSLKEDARKRHSPTCEGCSICFPGWFGATHSAKQLAEKLARPVAWAFPPDDAKDLRDWFRAHCHDATADELGRRLVAGLKLTTVEPPRVEIIVPDERTAITLNEAREQMHSAKTQSIGQPGIYLDRSPTGAGKSHSDIAAVRKNLSSGGRSQIVLPTHKNCREAEAEFECAGINAVEYPPRLTKDTKDYRANCWNLLADEVEAAGLPVARTVCWQCEHKHRCSDPGLLGFPEGYLGQINAAEIAAVSLATGARAAWKGLMSLSDGRSFVSVHEQAIGILRPTSTCSESDVMMARQVLDRLLNDPKSLDWFGEATRKDEDGKIVPNEKRQQRRDALYEFTKHLASVADEVAESVVAAKQTCEFAPKAAMPKSSGIEWLVYSAGKRDKVQFDGPAWKVLLALASGETHSAAIIVGESREAGGVPIIRRNVLAVWHNPPPFDSAAVWFNDATASKERLAFVLGTKVTDKTPEGRIELVQRAVQIPKDITRKTSGKTVAGLLRGLLTAESSFLRVGVICHRPHVEAVKSLGGEFQQRIAKVSYFGSGDERASNEWHRDCDALIVLGTPRLPPQAVESFLIQCGDVAAATRQPVWETYRWRGVTESGKLRDVEARGYRDEVWRAADRELVRAELIQAIGRGRGILDDGIPVIVLSTEECGLRLADADQNSSPLSETDERLLAALDTLSLSPPFGTPPNAKKDILGKTGVPKGGDAMPFVPVSELATLMKKSDSWLRELLGRLEGRGLVERDGQRGGWRRTARIVRFDQTTGKDDSCLENLSI